MRFEKAKRLVTILLVFSIMACVVGLLFGHGNREFLIGTAAAALASLLLAGFVIVKYCRCPWCGKLLLRRMFAVRTCPDCRRDIETGKRRKGKGGGIYGA